MPGCALHVDGRGTSLGQLCGTRNPSHLVRRLTSRWAFLCVAVSVAVVLSGATAPPVQAEEAEIPYSEQRLATEWSKACPEPKAGEETCELLRPPLEGDESEGPGSGPNGGLTPAELRSRYGLTNPAAGAGEEVAVINSGGYPHANQDRKLYREHYELSTCDEEDSCFRTVNGRGEEGKYPTTELRATEEDGLDLDMVSAACPACRILLVEAEPNKSPEAVEEAVRLGANVVTNSWTFGPEWGKASQPKKTKKTNTISNIPASRLSSLPVTASTASDGRQPRRM